MATRWKKDVSQRPEDLVRERRARAGELGFGPEELGRVMGRPLGRAALGLGRELAFEDLAGPLGPKTIEAAADAFLRSPHVVAIVPSAGEASGSGGATGARSRPAASCCATPRVSISRSNGR